MRGSTNRIGRLSAEDHPPVVVELPDEGGVLCEREVGAQFLGVVGAPQPSGASERWHARLRRHSRSWVRRIIF